MIFITIGTQAPFDRLIKAMDEITPLLNGEKVIAQIFGSEFRPVNMEIVEFLNPVEFDKIFAEASLIIGHAGMGTIISALTSAKKIIVMPRKASLGEHRNEHQLATANKMKSLGLVEVANDYQELKDSVLRYLRTDSIVSESTIGNSASSSLVNSIEKYIKS